jgi:hypothetical protein
MFLKTFTFAIRGISFALRATDLNVVVAGIPSIYPSISGFLED